MDTKKFYARSDIQEELLRISKDREVQVWYGDIRGKRPDSIQFKGDILESVKKGATSFHISEERWKDPLLLKTGMTKNDFNNLIKGWDFVIDIDGKTVEYSKVAASLLVDALKFYGVKSISVKFSVTGDTPVLVKDRHNDINLILIKEAIEKFKKEKSLEILSLNRKNNLIFSKIYDSLVHKDTIYSIYHEQSNLPLKTTAHHSVYIWEDSFIKQKAVKDLKIKDYLITFRNSNTLKSQFKNYFTFSYNLSKKEVKDKIKITKDLCILIGYYLSEGHITERTHEIGFSFNKNEREYVFEVSRLIKKLVGVDVHKRYPNKNSIQLTFNSRKWYAIFKKLCDIKKNKHVPSFIWSSSKHYFIKLLTSYLKGDAYKLGKYRIVAKSVSYRLIGELIWLCKLHNISPNLYYEKNKPHTLPQGTHFKGSSVFMIGISKSELDEFYRKRNKYSPFPRDKTFPTDGLKKIYSQIKPKKYLMHRKEHATLRKRSANLNRILDVINWFENYNSAPFDNISKRILANYKNLIKEDITTIKIKRIHKNKKKSLVYDVSVKGSERFFGNYYPVLLHNSGNKGFHIGIPFESFPDKINNQETKLMFPDALRIVAEHLKEMIAEHLEKKLKRKDVFSLVDIDTVLISSRHLFRAPYSFNEKSGLVSIPINPEDIMRFDINKAKSENVVTDFKFLSYKGDNIKELLMQSFDSVKKKVEVGGERKYEIPTVKSNENLFPPCIQEILKGVKGDGRKRAVFILINFLRSVGWGYGDIKTRLEEWDGKNYEPLKKNYIEAQIAWNEKQGKNILPPNCINASYYKGLGFCNPDNFCKMVKNPVNYSLKKGSLLKRSKIKE